MTVKNMSYKVPLKKGEMKTILHDMSFYLKPGMMCLVLGSPGGGRTSMFKVPLEKWKFIFAILNIQRY
jgi:ABC-type multidrug transport system ATPase subunit